MGSNFGLYDDREERLFVTVHNVPCIIDLQKDVYNWKIQALYSGRGIAEKTGPRKNCPLFLLCSASYRQYVWYVESEWTGSW